MMKFTLCTFFCLLILIQAISCIIRLETRADVWFTLLSTIVINIVVIVIVIVDIVVFDIIVLIRLAIIIVITTVVAITLVLSANGVMIISIWECVKKRLRATFHSAFIIIIVISVNFLITNWRIYRAEGWGKLIVVVIILIIYIIFLIDA